MAVSRSGAAPCAGTVIPRGAAAQGKAIDPAKIVKTDDYARSHPRVRTGAPTAAWMPATRLRRGVYNSAPSAFALAAQFTLRNLIISKVMLPLIQARRGPLRSVSQTDRRDSVVE